MPSIDKLRHNIRHAVSLSAFSPNLIHRIRYFFLYTVTFRDYSKQVVLVLFRVFFLADIFLQCVNFHIRKPSLATNKQIKGIQKILFCVIKPTTMYIGYNKIHPVIYRKRTFTIWLKVFFIDCSL